LLDLVVTDTQEIIQDVTHSPLGKSDRAALKIVCKLDLHMAENSTGKLNFGICDIKFKEEFRY